MKKTIKILFISVFVLAAPSAFANHLSRFGNTDCGKYWHEEGSKKYGHCFTVVKNSDKAEKSLVKNECDVDLKVHIGVEYSHAISPSNLNGFGWSVETIMPAGEEIILRTPGDFTYNIVEWFFCENG